MIAGALVSLLSGTPAQLPAPDPLGYPVPAPLLQLLSHFTLTLHFLAVNFTLGALMLLLWTKIVRRPQHATASGFLRASLPLGFSYLVTLGIPPLLFVQVVYGQLFYTSSVIVGAFWILIIPALILSYGLLYLHKLTDAARPRRQPAFLAVALLGMLYVGFMYVNNITLSMHPERWMGLYAASPAGVNLHLAEPTLFPRWLLLLSPALVVAGAALSLAGGLLDRWKNADGPATAHLGLRAHLLGRGVMLLCAVALIATLPDDIRRFAIEDRRTFIHLLAGLGTALGVTTLVVIGHRRKSPPLSITGIALMALEGMSFVAARDFVRLAYLKEHFTLADVPVHPQWGMLAIFLVSMVAGLAFLVVLTVKVTRRAIAAKAS